MLGINLLWISLCHRNLKLLDTVKQNGYLESKSCSDELVNCFFKKGERGVKDNDTLDKH